MSFEAANLLASVSPRCLIKSSLVPVSANPDLILCRRERPPRFAPELLVAGDVASDRGADKTLRVEAFSFVRAIRLCALDAVPPRFPKVVGRLKGVPVEMSPL